MLSLEDDNAIVMVATSSGFENQFGIDSVCSVASQGAHRPVNFFYGGWIERQIKFFVLPYVNSGL